MEMYTIIYSFMWRSLRLAGATKEVFAVIFNFWKAKQAPVEIANSVFREITGLSHSSIVEAKNRLVVAKLISVHEIRGKSSLYEVHLPTTVSRILTPPDSTMEMSEKQTGRESRPKVNYKNFKKIKNRHGNKSLSVGTPSEFTGDDKI